MKNNIIFDRIDEYFHKYFYLILFIFISIQSFFYINHITDDYKLLNEYRYMDESTNIGDKTVSNYDYINKYLLFNPYSEQKYTSNNIYFDDKRNLGLSFNNMSNYYILDSYQKESYKNFLVKYNSSLKSIPYSKEKKMLYSDYLNKNNFDKDINNTLYIEGNILKKYFSNYPSLQADSLELLKEKMDFIYFNIYEQNMQIFDRYYFHENSFLLSPINEMNLNRLNSEIFSQYGYLSVKIIKGVMDLFGGFSLNNYEKAKKTVDQLYYLLAVILILFFFKDNYIRLGFILFLGIALYGNKYYAFSYAPTVTNSRHILDLIIITILYKYMTTKRFTYLYIAIILSILSIWIAKDFGQFIILSMIATLTIPLGVNYLKKNSVDKFLILSLFITLLIGFLSLKYYPMMQNPSIKYFLDGFYSFPFNNNAFYFLVLLIVFIQWVILVYLYNKLEKNNYLYAYIFVLFYTQFLYTYFIWHGTVNNIVMYCYIYALPSMIVYNLFNFKFKRFLSFVIVFSLLIVYAKTLNSFIYQKKDYDNVFKTHKLYKWDYPRAGGIISTYSFEPFEDSINLIKKYVASDKIYMISKYDNILGILSEKYSGFPFFELRSSIVTLDEFDMIKNQINNEADILFVDNDIDRDFNREMKKMSFFDLDPFWRNESLKQRIPKLENLNKLWKDVKKDYTLVEKGELISVYRKKNN